MKKWNEKKVMAHRKIVIVLVLSFFLVSCLNWILEKPSFVLREIILSPRSFTEMNLLLGFEVQNPNRFDITLKSFEYTLSLKDEVIGNGHLEKAVLIPSSSTTTLQVPVVAKFKDLGGSLKAVITGDDLPYRIEAKAEIGTSFGSHIFSFSKEDRINSKKK
ncbi:MAG: LEA type 2 family protein [Deltaproteobacteria bacterium]|nr:LEA type 2 family protein [Deltaproteobacteria bacterium]